MSFDIDYQSSLQSDGDNPISIQMSKTKHLPTKFFADLDKHQRIFNKRNQHTHDHNKKQISKKRLNKRSPTLKQMMVASRNYISGSISSIDDNINPIESKKKVRFNSKQQNSSKIKQSQRKPSIQKMAALTPYNFCDSIKQMALQLTESRMQGQKEEIGQNSNQSLFSGYTEKQFQDGTKFKGICQKGVIIRGQLHFANQFIYDGQLFLDKFHGKGKLVLPKKQTIEGDWIQGELVGKATIKYPKGQIYYGDLKNYRRNGKGHLFFADGSKYQGQFNQGELTGYGVHIATSGQKTAGYWFYGDFVGTNEQVFENVMTSLEAHEKKKTERQTKRQLKQQKSMTKSMSRSIQKKMTKVKKESKGKSKNILEQLFLNTVNIE